MGAPLITATITARVESFFLLLLLLSCFSFYSSLLCPLSTSLSLVLLLLYRAHTVCSFVVLFPILFCLGRRRFRPSFSLLNADFSFLPPCLSRLSFIFYRVYVCVRGGGFVAANRSD